MARETKSRKKRHASDLKAHRPAPGRKKLLQPPLRQLPLTDLRWPHDHVPNFLWAGGLVADDPDDGVFRIALVLDVMRKLLQERGATFGRDGVFLDGSLTTFDSVPEELRRDTIDHLRDRGLADAACPEGFVHAIRMYPDAPGAWLSDLCEGPDLHVDPDAAQRYLSPVIVGILDGKSAASTAIKASVFRQHLVFDRLRLDASGGPLEALQRYPRNVTDGERALIGSYVRATYGALSAADEDRAHRRQEWAKQFWRANWNLYPCLERAEEPAEAARGDEAVGEASAPDADHGAAEFEMQLHQLWAEFQRLAHTTDPDLYAPERHEVLTGLTAHGLRVAAAVAVHPGLWIGEFSAGLLRVIAEILIVLAWLKTLPQNDTEIYLRFKEFGRGRLKLLKLHIENRADDSESDETLLRLIDQLDAEVNEEVMEEFQDISIEGTFAGVDLRKMAQQAGADWVYKLSYAPMSSVTHSEWPILARYAMRRCVNPLHRFHRIPRPDMTPSLMPVGGRTAVFLAGQLLDAYRVLITPAVPAQRGAGDRGVPAESEPAPDR